jgi:hypothetical protein
MLKRSLAALLWFYAGWYAGAIVAFHLGLSDLLGPILGIAAAGLIAGDPRHAIWVRQPEVATAPASTVRDPRPDPA